MNIPEWTSLDDCSLRRKLSVQCRASVSGESASTRISKRVIFLVVTQGTALTFSRKGRYIPNLKIAEEIDISDVTFTTPATDSVHVANVINPKVSQRNKPRVIIPVVAYHKSNHPPSQLITSTLYKGRKPRKFKFIPLTRSVNDVIGHGIGYKASQASSYRRYNAPQKTRPVYYLVGDEAANVKENYNSQIAASGKHGENFRLYNEKELQFVKPYKRQPYPKKYSSPVGESYNRDVRPEEFEDEADTSENTQMIGQSTDNTQTQKGDRVEFQMYGMDGPNSYKFGYDTGKGDNRHFRFEERDSEGKIRGHYGYMDNEGKMRVMKYEADPETGFHAGPVDLPSAFTMFAQRYYF